MVKNRSYTKAVIRAIRGSFSRFLAIFAIVALGVGFLAGLAATTPDMRYSAGVYYNDTPPDGFAHRQQFGPVRQRS